MSLQGKPSIVFVHGLWADGSCFSKLIPTLQKEAFEVVASQHGLEYDARFTGHGSLLKFKLR